MTIQCNINESNLVYHTTRRKTRGGVTSGVSSIMYSSVLLGQSQIDMVVE